MFIPTIPAQITKMNGGFDAEGNRLSGATESFKCGMVKLKEGIKKSPQDSDGSASQSVSDERLIVAIVLIPTSITPAFGDKVEAAGLQMRLESVWPQFNTSGAQDHWECEASMWTGI